MALPRDCYETVVALPDATGVLKVLSNVKVSVVPRGATDVAAAATQVNVFQSYDGAAKGPDPNCGATGTNNPMITSSTGAIRFWAEAPAEYDIVFEDINAPPRINDRVGWNATPGKSGSIPTSYLAEDGGITEKMLSPKVVEQQVPIGGVIEWWRPASTVGPPAGFEVCDGHQVMQHEFPGISGSINVPDLRNVFILGADKDKAHGSGAGGSDPVDNAPGVAGTGGSNQHTLLAAESGVGRHTPTGSVGGINGGAGVLNHQHNFTTSLVNDHQHGAPGNPHFFATRGGSISPGGGGWPLQINLNSNYVLYDSTWTDPAGGHNHVGTTDAGQGGVDHTHALALNEISANAGSPHNNMPKWVGLLRIMKVRRT